MGAAAALLFLLLWPLAAFGGRSFAAALIFGAANVLLALVVGRKIPPAPHMRTLDRALLGIVVGIVLQMLPLPATIVNVLSPHAAAVRENLALIRSATAWSWLSIVTLPVTRPTR